MKLTSIMKPFVFFTLGDWGGYTPSSIKMMNNIAEQMSFVAKYKPPLFLSALGDNFYDRGIESADDERWNTHYYDIYIKPYPNLHNLTWYPILGNHDYYGGQKSINAEILHTKKVKTGVYHIIIIILMIQQKRHILYILIHVIYIQNYMKKPMR